MNTPQNSAVDLWGEFFQVGDAETRPEVLDGLERRALWRDGHPGGSITLDQLAQALGVRMPTNGSL